RQQSGSARRRPHRCCSVSQLASSSSSHHSSSSSLSLSPPSPPLPSSTRQRAMSALYGTPPPSATSNGFNHHHHHHSSSPSPFRVDDDDDLAFDSPKDEASYYRDKYRVAVELLNETRAELDEFQVSSRELEQELEQELEATEAKHADLQERITRLEADKEEWKNKFIALQKQHSSTVSAMQLEMDNLRSERDNTLIAIRDLEMGNDELESKHRVTHSSLLDMEIKYNRTIEEKTLLEQEVIAKQELDEECQRLKDDVRDANNEIAILRDRLAKAVVPTPPSSDAPMSPMTDLHARSDAPSPTLTDASGTTHRSSHSVAATSRTDRSPTVTPRTVRQSPRIPRSTTTPALASPNVRKALSAPSPSGIPSLTRSTTSRILASSETGPMRRTSTMANLSGQPPKTNKGLRLLQDIQTRLKATDDRLGARMPKRSVAPQRKSTLPSATVVPSGHHANAQHTRVAALSKPPPGAAITASATVTPTASSSNILSPTAWVMLSDPEDTPPARPGQLRKRDPSSPLETSRGVGGNMLPKRPGIPSPLAPHLARSHRGSPGHTPNATTRALHKTVRSSGRPPLAWWCVQATVTDANPHEIVEPKWCHEPKLHPGAVTEGFGGIADIEPHRFDGVLRPVGFRPLVARGSFADCVGGPPHALAIQHASTIAL
ncbi:unnamed protein product, partial [Cutaneotrichosporon oleaginosum]